MANSLYHLAKQDLLEGKINLLTATVKAQLVDVDAYTPDITEDDFLSKIPAAARVGNAVTLTNKSITKGVFDADDAVFAGVAGASVEACVLYLDSGDEATSRLLFFGDTATGLPIVPNSGDITAQWDNGVAKIFSL